MPEKSLFERLRRPSDEGRRRAGADMRELAESVVAHLRRMLNSRQGFTPTLPDYGVPDLTDVVRNFPDSTGGLEHALRRSIEQYEPRLRDVRVRYAPSADNPFELSFEIKARLVSPDSEEGIAFVTHVNPDGRVDVRR